ncbi:UDP-glucose dehydrogenase family protein [Pseudomonas putida]|uniref:UDP-glucose 6-dehydrogenase n=1 Tax=Pseudomonas putida TaxID=303 RepID=A0A2S3WH67_PSEPU|nr:UDP-glucose/GDP-mannose dehydrogenase family protein [Pseudomonas putida]POF90272.1 UDP-glucose 6-dehydrogenase [Pseudomonas putida]
MKITVFGSGYVGLVTGACLADVGHHVICVDVDQGKIDALKNGVIPIYEPGLEGMVLHNHQEKRLDFTTDARLGVAFGEIQIIAVGTPPDEDGSADLKYVLAVAETIGTHMTETKIIVDKSTVPVGTADKVAAKIVQVLESRGVALDFDVCSNPEFLKEGAAIEDFTKGARIVVGTDSEHVRRKMRECYAPYSRNHDKLIFMDVRSAELTKYAANAMLATKISFMNELSNLAERLGADIEQVRIGIGSDPRIGYSFIYPGCGYGGSCFPKDVQALYRTALEVGYDATLLKAVEAVNNRQKDKLFNTFSSVFGSRLAGTTVAVWGLAFKPNTDDMRDAPSRSLIEKLWQAGVKVRVYDPKAMGEFKRIYGERDDLVYAASMEEALAGADALAICTEWKSFRAVEPKSLHDALATHVVIDGRNLFDPWTMAQAGVNYHAIGRPHQPVGA